MSTEAFAAFRQAVLANETLRGELQAAADSTEALVAFAAERGFHFTAHDVQEQLERELDLADLDRVAGGAGYAHYGDTEPTQPRDDSQWKDVASFNNFVNKLGN